MTKEQILAILNKYSSKVDHYDAEAIAEYDYEKIAEEIIKIEEDRIEKTDIINYASWRGDKIRKDKKR